METQQLQPMPGLESGTKKLIVIEEEDIPASQPKEFLLARCEGEPVGELELPPKAKASKPDVCFVLTKNNYHF